MNDEYGYDAMKKMMNKETNNNQVNVNNDRVGYEETKGVFDMNRNNQGKIQVRMIRTNGQVPVRTKPIEESKFKSCCKKAAVAVVAVVIGGTGIIYAVDGVVHPENYSTEYENYKGRATTEEVKDRTPDNFKEIKDRIVKGGR